MEKKFKGSKFSLFLKKNIYLILMIVCLIAIIGMIAYTFTRNQANDSLPSNSIDASGNPIDQDKNNPDDKNPSGNEDKNNNNNNNDNSNPTFTEVLTEIAFPVANPEVLKAYTDTELVFNATMKHWATHQGVDFKAPVGTEVKAVFDGEVVSISTTNLKGTTVTIKHSSGFESSYSLLGSDVKVKVGQKVKKGDVLGTVAETGVFESADAPHLHFEFRKDGELINPDYYFEGGNK